jgi:hypothetical protein
MHRLSRTLLVVAALSAAPALQAQEGVQVAPPVSQPAPTAPAVSDAPVTLAPVPAMSVPTAPPKAPSNSFGKPEALMVIGVAAMVGGALVGGAFGYVVAVGGLVVGLYGLWQYLQH